MQGGGENFVKIVENYCRKQWQDFHLFHLYFPIIRPFTALNEKIAFILLIIKYDCGILF